MPAAMASNKKSAKQAAAKTRVAKQAAAEPSPLLTAAQALIDGDTSALPTLLAAWRECPSPILGELISRFGPDEHELATLTAGSTVDLTRRVVKLGRREPDPRIAIALAELVVSPPFTSGSMKPMWTSLFEQLTTRHVDPRALERLRAADVAKQFGATNMGKWVTKQLAGAIEQLAARFDDHPPGLPEDAAIAASLPATEQPAPAKPKSSAEPSEQALVDACLATFDDDAPRLRYADWLDANGRAPQAEFIRLQLARARSNEAPSEREQLLVNKYAAKWLAPIVPVLKKGTWTFERGLLDTCTIYPRKGKATELAGHPLWASVRAVKLSETGDPAPIITHPIMARLRAVELWTYPRGLAGLLDSDAPIELLDHVYLPNVVRDRALWTAFVGCTRLPRLALLNIGGATLEHARTIAAGGLARPGLRIVYTMYDYRTPAWLAELTQQSSPHPAVTIATQETEFEFEPATRTLRATLARDPAEGLWDVGLALGPSRDGEAQLQPGQLDALELRLPVGGVEAEYPHRGELDSSAAVFAMIEQRCRALGCKLIRHEGQWPSRYVGHKRVRL